jgi:hypothetical protein
MTNHIMALVETYVADRIELSKRRDVSLKSERTLDACGWVDDSHAALQQAQPANPLTDGAIGGSAMTHTLNSNRTVAVSVDVYWIPVSKDTPRGVKLQLLGAGGVATYGTYHGDPFWTHWQSLPKIPQ